MTDALKQLGMNRKQSAVYLSLLQLGPATVFAIAEKSGLKRPTVYVVLGELVRQEAVQRIPHAKRQMFQAKPPDQLVRERVLAIDAVREILPQLLALTPAEEKPTVLYYEGIAGAEQAFRYRLDDLVGKEIVGFFAHTEHESLPLKELFTWYNNQLRQRGAHLRGIAPAHTNLAAYRERDAAYSHIIRSVPLDRYDSTISIEVAPDFVRIFAFKHVQAIIIDNPMIARSLRQIFEMVWAGLSVLLGSIQPATTKRVRPKKRP